MSQSSDSCQTADIDITQLASAYDRCVVRDGSIWLDGDLGIALDRCNAPEKILAWIDQVGDRPRLQPLLRPFVLAAAHYNNVKIHYGM